MSMVMFNSYVKLPEGIYSFSRMSEKDGITFCSVYLCLDRAMNQCTIGGVPENMPE